MESVLIPYVGIVIKLQVPQGRSVCLVKIIFVNLFYYLIYFLLLFMSFTVLFDTIYGSHITMLVNFYFYL